MRLAPGNVRILTGAVIALASVALGISGLVSEASAGDSERPRLVLQVTVDQLRGDLPLRYRDRLGAGGFRFLLEKGTHFANAHYRHANTETAVGHATLFTGADPSGQTRVGSLMPARKVYERWNLRSSSV